MNIEVKDHNSKIMHMIPSHLQKPITLIAKIKGFENVDDYVISIIKDDLVSIREGGQGVEDIGEYVIKYLEKDEYLEKIFPYSIPAATYTSTSTTNSYDDDNIDDNEKEEEDKMRKK